MSSPQLNDLGPEELKQHVGQVLYEAVEAPDQEAADQARMNTIWGAEERAAAAMAAANEWSARVHARAAHPTAVVVRAKETRAKAKAIANLDILHRQQMMGDWSDDINEAYIQDRIYETRPDVIKAKKETKEHMGSMLGDWDKAGKLIKRHTSKNRKKTKRKRQKIAKRIKGTKRRK